MNKLIQYGVPIALLLAGASYLSNRIDRPVINGYMSRLATAQELYSQGDVKEARKVAKGLQADLTAFDRDAVRDPINSTGRTAQIRKDLKSLL